MRLLLTLVFAITLWISPFITEAGLVLSPSQTDGAGRTYITVCDDESVSSLDTVTGASQAAGLVIVPSPDLPDNCRRVEVTGMSGGEIQAFFRGKTELHEVVAGAQAVAAQESTTGQVNSGQGFDDTDLVPAGRDGDYSAAGYGTCEFVQLINNVTSFLLWFASIAATIVFIVAGFQLVMSGGDVSAKESAKSKLVNVLIGYVIVLASFLIVNLILNVLLNPSNPALNWQQIECLYATEPELVPEGYYQSLDIAFNPDFFAEYGNVDVLIQRGQFAPTLGSGGSCSVVNSGACSTANMGCFSNAADASRVCNLESSGGNFRAVSGSDLCADGNSFSGGLWQINVLANYDKIPGCSGDFFTKNGSSAQGDCLTYRTNSNGVRYCQYRDCRITDVQMYNYCMTQTLDPQINTQIACDLYSNGGWNHWITSAQACSVVQGL